jgi:hypothetical protein
VANFPSSHLPSLPVSWLRALFPCAHHARAWRMCARTSHDECCLFLYTLFPALIKGRAPTIFPIKYQEHRNMSTSSEGTVIPDQACSSALLITRTSLQFGFGFELLDQAFSLVSVLNYWIKHSV